jgi:hypothetical protein
LQCQQVGGDQEGNEDTKTNDQAFADVEIVKYGIPLIVGRKKQLHTLSAQHSLNLAYQV